MRTYLLLSVFALLVFSCREEYNYNVPVNTVPEPPIIGKTLSATEVTAFKQMVSNAGAGNGDQSTVKKWQTREVLVHIVNPSFGYLNNELDSILRDINALTNPSLVFKKTADRSSAKTLIYLTDRNTFANAQALVYASFLKQQADGYAYTFWGSDDKLDGSVVFIDMARSNSTSLDNRYILRHELMHTLGFYGHVTSSEFSTSNFFQFRNLTTSYSAFDKKMISLLYNPAVKAGMNGADLNAVLVNL